MSNWVWFMGALGAGTQQFSMAGGHGTYSLSGGVSGTHLVADSGVFTLSAVDTVVRGYKTPAPAAAASYVLTGYSIGPFIRDHRLFAGQGTYRTNGNHSLLKKTFVPVKAPAPYVEEAWERPEAEGDDLDAQVTVDVG